MSASEDQSPSPQEGTSYPRLGPAGQPTCDLPGSPHSCRPAFVLAQAPGWPGGFWFGSSPWLAGRLLARQSNLAQSAGWLLSCQAFPPAIGLAGHSQAAGMLLTRQDYLEQPANRLLTLQGPRAGQLAFNLAGPPRPAGSLLAWQGFLGQLASQLLAGRVSAWFFSW